MRCKVFDCPNEAENEPGSHSGVCYEHSNVRALRCRNCYVRYAMEGAYAWSRMRWVKLISGDGCGRNKHELVPYERNKGY